MKELFETILLVAAAFTFSNAQEKKIVSYFPNDANAEFDVDHINPHLCTHLMYCFVGLGEDFKVRSLNPAIDFQENDGKGTMKKFTGLKKENPSLKTLVAVGGWTEGSQLYSRMASAPEYRKLFIDSVIQLLKQQDFDGLDFHWMYPAYAYHGGKPEDKENFVILLAELRAEFDKSGYLLTAAVSADEPLVKAGYAVPEVSKHLDFINLLAYDLHSWERFAHHHAPLFPHPMDESKGQQALNVDSAVKLWIELGAPAEKLILGMAAHGRGFYLVNAENNGIYAQTSQDVWSLGYNQLCSKIESEKWNVVRDANIKAPYAYKESQWVGYDDAASISLKVSYAKDNNLGGAMLWAMNKDDYGNKCGHGAFPLLTAIRNTLNGCPVCKC